MNSLVGLLAGILSLVGGAPPASAPIHAATPQVAVQHVRRARPVMMEATQKNGTPPLTVDYTIPVTTQEDADAYSVDFGDGEYGKFTLECKSAGGKKTCYEAVATHIYKTSGGYAAYLMPYPICAEDGTDEGTCAVDNSDQNGGGVSQAG